MTKPKLLLNPEETRRVESENMAKKQAIRDFHFKARAEKSELLKQSYEARLAKLLKVDASNISEILTLIKIIEPGREINP